MKQAGWWMKFLWAFAPSRPLLGALGTSAIVLMRGGSKAWPILTLYFTRCPAAKFFKLIGRVLIAWICFTGPTLGHEARFLQTFSATREKGDEFALVNFFTGLSFEHFASLCLWVLNLQMPGRSHRWQMTHNPVWSDLRDQKSEAVGKKQWKIYVACMRTARRPLPDMCMPKPHMGFVDRQIIDIDIQTIADMDADIQKASLLDDCSGLQRTP